MLTLQSSVTLMAVVRERMFTYYSWKYCTCVLNRFFLIINVLIRKHVCQVMVVTNVLPRSPLCSLCLTTWNEMNRALGHLCAHIGWTGPGEPPEDGEIDDWDDTVLQTQDSKFEPWWAEAEHATSRSRRLPTILTFTRGWGRNIFYFFQTAETGNRTPSSGVKGSGANHYPRAPARLTTYRHPPPVLLPHICALSVHSSSVI